MDSGHNPTSPMPGNGPAPAVPPTPVTPTPPTVPPVAPSAPNPAPAATPFTPPAPQTASVMNSRRTRSSRPASANNMVAVPPQPATNDIVLNSGPAPKKGINKGLIIGIIAAVVLVVGGIAALLLLPKGGGNSNKSQVQEAFAKLEKLIFDDSEDGEFVATPDYNNWTFTKKMELFPADYEQYVKDIKEQNDKLRNLISKSNAPNKEKMEILVSSVNDLVSVAKKYAGLEQMITDTVKTYVTNGENQASQEVESYKQDYHDEYANRLMKEIQNYLETYLKLVELADRQNCIDNNAVDITSPTCNNTTGIMNVYKNLETQFTKLSNFYKAALSALGTGIFNIKSELRYDW